MPQTQSKCPRLDTRINKIVITSDQSNCTCILLHKGDWLFGSGVAAASFLSSQSSPVSDDLHVRRRVVPISHHPRHCLHRRLRCRWGRRRDFYLDRRMPRFFLFRAYTSHVFAGAGSPEVEDGCFGIHFGLLWAKLGDGWSGDGMFVWLQQISW